MSSTWGVVVSSVATLALVVACSSGGGGSVATGASASSSDDFARQFCDFYRPCCEQAGRPSDMATCRGLAASAATKGTYDPAAGGRCLSDVRALSGDPRFCKFEVAGPDSCDVVYRTQNTGTKQPGEDCDKDSDCAASPEGKVDCRTRFVDGGTTHFCQVSMEGKAGDSPCFGTRDGNITSYTGSSEVTKGYICDVSKGVRCDSTTKQCTALAQIDAECTSSTGCVKGAYCDFQSKKCVPGKEAGADCTSSTECKSSRCTSGKCAADSTGSGGSSGTLAGLGLGLVCGT